MDVNEKDPADLTDAEIEALESAVTGADTGTEKLDEDDDGQAPGTDALEANTAVDATKTGEEQPGGKVEDPQPAKVAGILSKDGTRVLPFAALQSERREARRNATRASQAEERAQQLEQELADLKAGKKPAESTELTEDEVIQMEQDFPDHGKKLRAVYEKAKQFDSAKAPARAQDDAADHDDPIQDAIDQVPMLVEWQIGDPEKFTRAQVLDDALKGSPKWKDKPVAERFAHVAKLVADEFDIPMDEPQPATSKSKTTAVDPSRVIANATRTKPNTLSDFKGGTTPETPSTNFERLSASAQVDRWADMTDAEIDAALAKSGG